MDRIKYQPTEKQLEKWALFNPPEMPSDDFFKRQVKNKGKKGWGLKKAAWLLSNMKNDKTYQMGIWQGRIDALRGLDYSEDRNEKTYNLGYYRGYTNFRSDWKGLDSGTQSRLISEYGE